MRIVFVYTMSPRIDYLLEFFPSEGYYYLLSKMLDAKIVDEVLIVIDSKIDKELSFRPGMNCSVIRGFEKFPALLRSDDVIWVRGGFRGWHNILVPISEANHWLILYAANTPRQRWLFWDVIFNDLSKDQHLDSRGRFWFYWKKPTNPEAFYPINMPRTYDLCIGASYVHDHKCQWKTVDALISYKEIFNTNLRCVLPGGWYHGVETNKIRDKIEEHNLDVFIVGHIPRSDLVKVLNQSKLFIHLGGSGQNDRGTLEAMRCGTPVIIETPRRHAPFVSECPHNKVVGIPTSSEAIAKTIHNQLELTNEGIREKVFVYHENRSGMAEIVLPEMARLFEVFRKHPKADAKLLREEYLDPRQPQKKSTAVLSSRDINF